MQVAIGSFYPVLLLSGILWPVEGMPTHLQTISWYLPCTCACQALRDIMGRGWGVEGRLSVQLGLISSTAWIIIFLLASIVMIRIQQRSAWTKNFVNHGIENLLQCASEIWTSSTRLGWFGLRLKSIFRICPAALRNTTRFKCGQKDSKMAN